jgi:broad specificity phosphatase PhoE
VSDLQCPARIFLAREDRPRDAIPLTERLRGERIAHVYTRSVALAVLEEIADRHRGEAVLVVGRGADIAGTLAALACPPSPSGYVANGEYVLLEHDADGWRLG